jgi:hypothetical protein
MNIEGYVEAGVEAERKGVLEYHKVSVCAPEEVLYDGMNPGLEVVVVEDIPP